jgi:uncharacterized protein (DUF1330 family)
VSPCGAALAEAGKVSGQLHPMSRVGGQSMAVEPGDRDSPPPTQLEIPAMAKAYWIAAYRSVKDPDALAAYAKLGGAALQKSGARILARGIPAQVYDSGLSERTVLLEFDSVEQAIAAHDSPAYQEALRVLGNAVDRDLRIVEGVD